MTKFTLACLRRPLVAGWPNSVQKTLNEILYNFGQMMLERGKIIFFAFFSFIATDSGIDFRIRSFQKQLILQMILAINTTMFVQYSPCNQRQFIIYNRFVAFVLRVILQSSVFVEYNQKNCYTYIARTASIGNAMSCYITVI